MKLRTKLTLYFLALHLVLAAAAVFVLMEQPLLLFVVELAFAISVIVGYRLVTALFVPLDLIGTGAELISERDFTSRFVEVGQPEMDALVRVYNAMIDRLREERLTAEEQHQLLEKVVTASPSGIVICGFDGDVQQMNPAATKLVTPELLGEMRSMEAGESRLVQAAAPRRLKLWRAEFRDRGFSKSFYLIEELTDELRSSERAAYEKLIRMMSHEVNNSVGAVRSLLESLLRYAEQVADEDRDDFADAITIASDRVTALNEFMSSFADVVRLPQPHRRSARVAGVVQRIAALLRPELRTRGIEITVDADDSVASIDVLQFEQVVLNVLKNAADSIERDGRIVATVRDGVLTVADTGAGISSDAARDLFTPFFTTKRDGRGLGLTIVQEILTNHGFDFSLRNRDPRGAEFRIVMPAQAGERERPPAG